MATSYRARVLAVAILLFASPVHAASDEQVLVDRAKLSLDEFKADKNYADYREYLDKAKAVIIVPQQVKAGFIVGGEGGSAVLLVRGADKWSPPAFYKIGSVSVGLQIGAAVQEVLLLVMSDGAVDKLLKDKVSLGGDVSVAAGPYGAGLEARTTTNAGADIYAVARSKGAYGGVALKGGLLIPDEEANKAYYGKAATSREIVMEQSLANAGADPLRSALPGG